MMRRATHASRGRRVRIGAAIAAVMVVVGIARFAVRVIAPKLMERMAKNVMPEMMDVCFGQMSQDQRESMLTHCRGALDRVDEKYEVTSSAGPARRPVGVA